MPKEYDEEYMKSLMSGMTKEELDKLFALAESYYTYNDLQIAKSEANQILKLRRDIDIRLKEHRTKY